MKELKCKICSEDLLSPKNKSKYERGKVVTNEGCVVNPKIINGKEYYRNVCYGCFEKEFGRKPKRMNIVGYDMCFLMGVSEEDIKAHRELNNNVTKEGMIRRYGEEAGLIKWNAYRKKQADTNSFEYKKEKYGWTEEQYNEYNSSRAVTLENCQKRHGEEKGKQVFQEYCEKQKYVGCAEDYFIRKYGEEKGKEKFKEVNKKKKLTRSNFIRKYGEGIGEKRYEEYLKNSNLTFSLIAQELFENLYEKYDKGHSFFISSEGGYEYDIWLDSLQTYASIDFYNTENNKAIEFFGDYWHCYPKDYEVEYYHSQVGLTAGEIWERDSKRMRMIKEEHGIDVLVVWEHDYKKDKQGTVEKCLRFLRGENV